MQLRGEGLLPLLQVGGDAPVLNGSEGATVCTRPALSPFLTVFQSTGLALYPTRRSRTRRACCASTFLLSMSMGFAMDRCTASLVISWNITRRMGADTAWRLGCVKYCSTCQPMASPSRSGSVAMKISRAPLAIFLRSVRMSSFPSIVTYSGAKPLSMSMPSFLAGKSRTCPTVARTV
jgi:hypothetical protein